MDERHKVLGELRQYIENVDKETTLLLQNLQWDLKHFMQKTAMAACKYNSNHRMPVVNKEAHEKQCYLRHEGYSKEDILLPDPVEPEAKTVVRLNKQDIIEIINKASSTNPSFKRVFYRYFLAQESISIMAFLYEKYTYNELMAALTQGLGSQGGQPLTLDRLQQVYTANERRAIHDAVVSAAPFCHDLTDLALSSTKKDGQGSKEKSRMEILAELRDMKRRRAKYRVAAKTSHYSDVLRDVIKTQMELYAEAKGIFIKTEYGPKSYITLNKLSETGAADVVIKQERMSPDNVPSKSYKESDHTYDQQKKRHYEDKQRDHYESRHRSSDKRYNEDFHRKRHNSQRATYDDDQSKPKKHRTQGDHKDRHAKYYQASEEKVSHRYGSDIKHKNDDNYATERTKYYDRHTKDYIKHDRHREDKVIQDRNYSKSYQYSDRDDTGYPRKTREDHEKYRDDKPSSSRKHKYERKKH